MYSSWRKRRENNIAPLNCGCKYRRLMAMAMWGIVGITLTPLDMKLCRTIWQRKVMEEEGHLQQLSLLYQLLESFKFQEEKDALVCVVCKDSVSVGDMTTKLPCGHGYHRDCIVPWLGSRNSCPVCRFELPTDDPECEEEKKKRSKSTTTMAGGSSSSSG